MALGVVDRAMQAFGAEGLSQDQNLAVAWANLRTLRIADVCPCLCLTIFLLIVVLFAGSRRGMSCAKHARIYLSHSSHFFSGPHSTSWTEGAETSCVSEAES